MSWQPTLGAWPSPEGTHFRVWAPSAQTVEVLLDADPSPGPARFLAHDADGTFQGLFADVAIGARYRYRVDGQGPFPDPASRFQPEGVHGPSEVIDPARFSWTDASWPGVPLEDLVLYELHVGTFTPRGTFAGVIERLPYLVDLGVTAIELMPVADFPGRWNWGYDGVDLFAPARCYGRPDDLRQLVDAAHRLGLAVFLDVVYNHFGPDGNYLGAFSRSYFTERHHTAWGAALNFDDPHSDQVRRFFIENALHWVHEYHLDGLRLDATHAIVDDSPRHFLAELAQRVHASTTGRPVLVIAEDPRNLATMIQPGSAGGWGLDGVWADDFHHQMRRMIAGDNEGYYCSFTGTAEDLATTIRQGWFFCGERSPYHDEPRGTDPTGIPPRRFVHCIQNHDQIGNRALGERLNHQVEPATFRAVSTLLLCDPETPLLFMGQEWAASTPFQFFTDHHEELGRLVTAGRRQEFRHFSAFTDPAMREKIPDPQAETTFAASRLHWDERESGLHAGVLRLNRQLLRLRRTESALRAATFEGCIVMALDPGTILLLRSASDGPALLGIFRLVGAGTIDLTGQPALQAFAGRRWQMVLTSEDAEFSPDPRPPELDLTGSAPVVRFVGPAAVLLREEGE